MDTKRQATVITGSTPMNTKKLIRWAGLAAMGAGILFIAIQALHPLDVLSAVTTPRWAIVHYFSLVMDFLALLGLTGLYARQVEKSGWLALAGYLLFSLFWALDLGLHFVEAFILPLLATNAPKFVAGWLGIVNGHATEMNLGALPTIAALNGLVAYILGGLLFGIATLRAGILPRWAAGLLSVGIVLPLLGLLLGVQHPYDRIFAVPVGFALAWLGYALWSERREPAADPVPARGSPPAPPNRSRVSSLETAWRGQAAIRPLVS